MHPITNEPNAIYYFGNSSLIWSLIFAFLSGCNRQEPQVASSPTTAKLDSRPALQDILEKSVRELACIGHAASSGVLIQTNDRISQSEETSYRIPKAFLGKLLTHQFEPGISKRDRTGLELRKSMR